MDPFSHAIFGRTLIALDPRGRLSAGASTAAILGALAPDVDVLTATRGWDVYLLVHEIGTHSVAGSIVMGCAAATLVRLLKRRNRYLVLVVAATIGSLSHVLFDLVSGATIRLGWPFVQARARLPLVAMGDPWLIAMCALGAIALWVLRDRAFAVAATIVAAIAAFLVLKGALMATAIPQWRAVTITDTVVHHVAEASWSSLTEWDVSDRTPHALRRWHVSARGAAALSFSIPVLAEPSVVQASRMLDTVQNFLRAHEFGFPVAGPHEEGMQVLWSDIRYCRSSTECAVWFGGVFDPAGRAVRQIVRVGQWQQARPVTR